MTLVQGYTARSSSLKGHLRYDTNLGVSISGTGIFSAAGGPTPPGLRAYFADSQTEAIIEHNLNWARGRESKPAFQFAYLMLPTTCNQACRGCFMGQDKRLLPERLNGPHFQPAELDVLLTFLCEHQAKAVVYGGGGELFTWRGAFSLIEQVTRHGLTMVLFTNGALLSRRDVERLNDLGVSLIVSIRDTVEAYHNAAVGRATFRSTLNTIEHALAIGFHRDLRLAVEMPVTVENQDRVIEDFLPVMRSLGIVPMVEEYIQLATVTEEKQCCHSFAQSRDFFERACQKDRSLGLDWRPEFGARMLTQPRCRRPLYSFAVFPDRAVVDCPSHTTCYGNLREASLHDIIYSDRFRRAILDYELCPCSVFYTRSHSDIPSMLPQFLQEFV